MPANQCKVHKIITVIIRISNNEVNTKNLKKSVIFENKRNMFPLYQSLYKHLPPPPTSMSNGLILPVPEHHLPGNPDLSSKTAESPYDTSNIFAAAMAWHQHSMLRSNSSPTSLGENLLYAFG